MVIFVGKVESLTRHIENAFKEDDKASTMQLLLNELGADDSTPIDADLATDLEIAFRQYMEKLLGSVENTSLLNSPPAKFIHFSVNFAEIIYSKCAIFAKVPFQLIDDFLEDKDISQAKEIWPLLESLAVKLTSETLFSKGKFIMLKMCNFLLKKLSKACDTEFCGRVLLFLAAIYPISEKSAINIPGRINTTNITHYDSKEEFESQVKPDVSADEMQEDGEASDELHITYTLYENFWKLQTFFASELKTFDCAAPTWADFVTNAKAVVEILKSSEPTELAGANTASTAEKDSHHNSYQGTKYLTSSQLFSLQLRDPQLRQQVAVQLLIFTHYFKVKSLPAVVSAEQRVNFLKDIVTLHNEAKKIIERIPGAMGMDLVTVIHRILEREENWIRWKTTGAQPFEKEETVSMSGMKRSADEMLAAAAIQEAKFEKRRALPVRPYSFDCSTAHIKQVVSQWEQSETHFADKIQEYIDADDPECGIDEEYHPKHNHLYCWRTRRMLAEKDFSTFDVMVDGDLGKGLRKYKNLPEPPPKPQEPEEEQEEEKEAEKEVEKAPETKHMQLEEGEYQEKTDTRMDVEEGEEIEDTTGEVTMPQDANKVTMPQEAMQSETTTNPQVDISTTEDSTINAEMSAAAAAAAAAAEEVAEPTNQIHEAVGESNAVNESEPKESDKSEEVESSSDVAAVEADVMVTTADVDIVVEVDAAAEQIDDNVMDVSEA